MGSKRMTKQVKKMVEEVNEYLRENHVKDMSNPMFNTMCWLLQRADCYHGFNLYTVDGKLSGLDVEKFDHLEIYTR